MNGHENDNTSEKDEDLFNHDFFKLRHKNIMKYVGDFREEKEEDDEDYKLWKNNIKSAMKEFTKRKPKK